MILFLLRFTPDRVIAARDKAFRIEVDDAGRFSPSDEALPHSRSVCSGI